MARQHAHWWKDLLAVHVADRRGTTLLLLTVLTLGAAILHQHRKGPDREELQAVEARMTAWVASREGAPLAKRSENHLDTLRDLIQLFPFDPNTASDDEFAQLGLLPRQVKALRNYLSHGGHFDSKAEFSRFRAIDPKRMEKLLPLLLLPDEDTQRRRKQERHQGDFPTQRDSVTRPMARPTSPRRMLELNSSDSLALVALPGIGPVYAQAILRHRERLGGYRHLDQLAEIRLFQQRPEALAQFAHLLVVDTLLVRTIPINQCTVEELAEHPYVDWQVAKALMAYRRQHGPFATVEAVRGCLLIDEELYRKLAPYLSAD